MHAIAHGGRMDTVRESALEADSGRKSLAAHWLLVKGGIS